MKTMISVNNDSHRQILVALNDALAKHETVQFGDRRFVPVYSREDGWGWNEMRMDEALPGPGPRGLDGYTGDFEAIGGGR